MCDAHCHVDDLINCMGQTRVLLGLGPTIAVTNDWISFLKTKELTRRQKEIYPSLGMHPSLASSWAEDLPLFISHLHKTRFVGEIGLDYTNHQKPQSRRDQESVFKAILCACERTDKILNVHSTRAEDETVRILMSYDINKVIMHWFAGPLHLTKEGIQEGWYFSIPPAVSKSRKLQHIARIVPDEQLLVESDAPYGLERGLSLGKTLEGTVKEIARLRQVSVAHMRRIIWRNFTRLLDLSSQSEPDQKTLREWAESSDPSQ